MRTNHEKMLMKRFESEVQAFSVETGYELRSAMLVRMYETGRLMDQYNNEGLPIEEMEDIVSENLGVTTRTIKNYRKAYAYCVRLGYETFEDLLDNHPKQKAISLEDIYKELGIKRPQRKKKEKEKEFIEVPTAAFKIAKKEAMARYKGEPKIRKAVLETIEFIRKFKG